MPIFNTNKFLDTVYLWEWEAIVLSENGRLSAAVVSKILTDNLASEVTFYHICWCKSNSLNTIHFKYLRFIFPTAVLDMNC